MALVERWTGNIFLFYNVVDTNTDIGRSMSLIVY